jgi:hypothetical protein
MGGDFFKKMAVGRGVPLDRVIPELGSPEENDSFEILRPVFERHQTILDAVKLRIVVGPGVWVLTASLENAIKHLGALEKFTTDLSDELEGSQGPCFRGCPIRSVPSMPALMVSLRREPDSHDQYP